MSKLNSGLNKDSMLNLSVKSQLDKNKLRKIRRTLLSLTEMDLKATQSYNVTVAEKAKNENMIATPEIIPLRNDQEDLEKIKQNDVNIVNKIYFEQTE